MHYLNGTDRFTDLPTFLRDLCGKLLGKYTSHVDLMGFISGFRFFFLKRQVASESG